MTGAAAREAVMLAGRGERARVARAFVGGALGPGHPCGDVAVLLVSELFANSVRHSGSGAPGETVTVAVRGRDGVIRIEVTDRSGPGVPELRAAGSEADGGQDLGWWRGWLPLGPRHAAALGRADRMIDLSSGQVADVNARQLRGPSTTCACAREAR